MLVAFDLIVIIEYCPVIIVCGKATPFNVSDATPYNFTEFALASVLKNVNS
jgi:hypothetical protein